MSSRQFAQIDVRTDAVLADAIDLLNPRGEFRGRREEIPIRGTSQKSVKAVDRGGLAHKDFQS